MRTSDSRNLHLGTRPPPIALAFGRVPATAVLILGLLIITLVGCGGDDATGPNNEVVNVEVSPSTGTLSALGATLQLSAVPRNSDGRPVSGRTITWSSSDQNVATVNSSGLVSAVANGTATITAAVDSLFGSATITVQQSVATLVVSPTPLALAVAETAQLSTQTEDANGNPVNATVTWSSSNNAVATVGTDGLVTAVAPGTVAITAQSGGEGDNATITVLAAEMELMRDLLDESYYALLLDLLPAAKADQIREALDEVRRGMAEGDPTIIGAALVAARNAVSGGDPTDAVTLAILGLVIDHCGILLDQYVTP